MHIFLRGILMNVCMRGIHETTHASMNFPYIHAHTHSAPYMNHTSRRKTLQHSHITYNAYTQPTVHAHSKKRIPAVKRTHKQTRAHTQSPECIHRGKSAYKLSTAHTYTKKAPTHTEQGRDMHTYPSSSAYIQSKSPTRTGQGGVIAYPSSRRHIH